MADVTLAEFNGNVWMVGGEQHLDALLFNTLPADVTIELLACASQAELRALWVQHSGGEDGAEPWVIHPNVARRIRGGGGAICFAPWSAMLDEAAHGTIRATAAALADGARLTLRQSCPMDAPAGLADLQRLRGQLVAGALVSAGVAAERLDHASGPAAAIEDADRLVLLATVE